MEVSVRDDLANNNLPASITRVVGRNEVIQLLVDEIDDNRLVSIVGAGGIGKTTVALAVAEQMVGSFNDGVWLVDFAPLRDRSLVPLTIATAIGLVVHSSDVQAALDRFFRQRELLLVLDNCEHMIDEVAACVAGFSDTSERLRILTTSREPLNLIGEKVLRLPGLAVPPPGTGLTAEGAMTYPAIELFVERAADRLEAFVLTDVDAPAVSEICRRLDGIALAIELAAMRIDVFGVAGLRKQLDDRFRILSGRRAGLERHRTLEATLDWSYGLLPVSEAEVLRAVSVFAGLFRASDGAALTGVPLSTVATILTELVSKSLLSTDADSLGVTYRPLESTRAYCLDKLRACGEYDRFKLRHAEYLCEGLERAAGEMEQQKSHDWNAVHAPYIDNLRAALAWTGSIPAQRSLLIHLTAAGAVFWNHFSLTHESSGHLSRAIAELDADGLSATTLEMDLQLALAGSILHTKGILPEASIPMLRALEIAERAGQPGDRLRCLRLIGTYELLNGQIDTGIETLETFVGIAGASDLTALAEGETHLCVGEIFVGRSQSVRQRMQRLQERASKEDDHLARYQYSNRVVAMIVLCHAQYFTGFPESAAATAAKAVDYAREASHELSLCIALAWACLVYLWIGRDEDCSINAALLDELAEKHGVVLWRPVVTFCRGALAARHRETLSTGIADLNRATVECRAIRHMARLPYYIGVLAQAQAVQGRLYEAEKTIREALDLASAQNEKWCIPELIRIQAAIASARNQTDLAEALLLKSVSTAEEIGAPSWRLRASIELAGIWRSQSRLKDARIMLQAAYDTFTEGGETRDLLNAAQILEELRTEIEVVAS